jgi:hypothetical protein
MYLGVAYTVHVQFELVPDLQHTPPEAFMFLLLGRNGYRVRLGSQKQGCNKTKAMLCSTP